MPRFPVPFGKRRSTVNPDDFHDDQVAAAAAPSFRVLDRTEAATPGKSFDGGHRLSRLPPAPSPTMVPLQDYPQTRTMTSEWAEEDNMFAGLKTNRGSGSSNTTKTNSTDASSRHSNVSTAPSSATDLTQGHDDLKAIRRKPIHDAAKPPPPGILKQATRSFSFGSQSSKSVPAVPGGGNHYSQPDDVPPVPPVPVYAAQQQPYLQHQHQQQYQHQQQDVTPPRRSRAETASTANTVVPPKTEELDLGGDFTDMFVGAAVEKRASIGNLLSGMLGRSGQSGNNSGKQPAPINTDRSLKVEPSPFSWDSKHSSGGEHGMTSSPVQASPSSEDGPPAVPRHGKGTLGGRGGVAARPGANADAGGLKRASAVFGRRNTADQFEPRPAEDEDAKLLRESVGVASRFLSVDPAQQQDMGAVVSKGRYRRGEDKFDDDDDDNDNLFDNALAQSSRAARRFVARAPSPVRNKVMTNAQFEKYRSDRERQDMLAEASAARPATSGAAGGSGSGGRTSIGSSGGFAAAFGGSPYAQNRGRDSNSRDNGDDDDDEEPNYDDDEDDIERSRQMAKQRRKQEAQMAVYRQKMMKVTGAALPPSSSSSGLLRPNTVMSMSTPNLPTISAVGPGNNNPGVSDGSDEDEEVPLAILAAHGFPSKNRPPTAPSNGIASSVAGGRLPSMSSNPNLRASLLSPPSSSQQQQQRPTSMVGGEGGGSGSRLPVFARNLPQDPYASSGGIGANPGARESVASFAGGGGGPLPPGGLIGVIASEERSRAMRRGSPAQVDGGVGQQQQQQGSLGGGMLYDPVAGIPPQMMYPGAAPGMMMPPPQGVMFAPGDPQAQMHMNAQMQQFMQMQMHFMQQMMAAQQQQQQHPGMPPRQYLPGGGHLAAHSMGDINLLSRHSMVGSEMFDLGGALPPPHSSGGGGGLMPPRPDTSHARTMSMVQPSSASWLQPPLPAPGYAGSIRGGLLGAGGYYAPSIAPSERSNVGLPGRYRPVSQAPPPPPMMMDATRRASTASGALGGGANWDRVQGKKPVATTTTQPVEDDDDEEEGWEALKAKREKKRSVWRSKKSIGAEISALIS